MRPTEIKSIRAALGLSQYALADLLRVRQPTVARYEMDRTRGGALTPRGPALEMLLTLRREIEARGLAPNPDRAWKKALLAAIAVGGLFALLHYLAGDKTE